MFRTSVSPGVPRSIPAIPYIFIISCIRLLSSDVVIMEAMELSLRRSTLTSNLSLFNAFLKISVNVSEFAFNVSAPPNVAY